MLWHYDFHGGVDVWLEKKVRPCWRVGAGDDGVPGLGDGDDGRGCKDDEGSADDGSEADDGAGRSGC
jgi:hypothetical protein